MNLSVVIVNYNAGSALVDCVESIYATSKGAEVIVVDNASSDHSIARVQETDWGAHTVTIIRNERNVGFATACNIGTRSANGELVLYLNPDCVVQSGALENLMEILVARPDAGMVGGLLLNQDGTEQAGGRRAVPTPRRALIRMFGVQRLMKRGAASSAHYDLNEQPLPQQPIEVDAISGACMLIRRRALEEVGGLDEGYFMHCEDLDWCMRFREAGWKVLFVPSARIVHAKGVCSKTRPIFVEWHKHKGMVRFYRRFFRHQYPVILLWMVQVGVWSRFGGVLLVHGARSMGAWFGWRRG